ncbi:MAG: Ig-like domain-containing protein [Phycisphaerae bacterium]|nr:Ig-like domain-containing protein [Phycisphaerae bacterium]
MKRRYRLTLSAAVFCCITLGCAAVRADTQADLDAALKKIDTELYKQSEADVRGLLDTVIERHWKPGKELSVKFDNVGSAAVGPMFMRAYEMLGDRKYKQAGLDFADALLQIQRKDGLFPASCVLRRMGQSRVRGGDVRFEDNHNFAPFAILVYAYKLSGDKKYLDAARRHADAVLGVQNPADSPVWRGGWPLRYGGKQKPRKHTASSVGYVINDYTTLNGMRTMLMMYFLTKDKKYIERIQLLPKWHIEAQLGIGNVRAWGDQYDAYNQPTWERNFESPMIEPRMFNRCVAPMLMYFYAVTGREVYRNLLVEGRNWLRSVEDKSGWAHEYTFDGRANTSKGYRVRLMDPKDGGRGKVVLEAIDPVIDLIKRDGLKGIRAWYGRRPTKYDAKQYLAARLAAARRVTDAGRVVRLWSLKDNTLVRRKFLHRVRQRALKRITGDLSGSSPYYWAFWRVVQPRFVPPRGWATWQYVWDVRVAQGKIDADTAAWGGRGIEANGAPTWFFEPWDMVGDWSTFAVEVENWLDIPLKPPVVHVAGAAVEPASITLKAAKEREIRLVLEPKDATCRTAVWTSSDEAVARVVPRMLDKIDPKANRPHYRTGGKLFVVAGKAGKATITATTTDGHHRAECKVTVAR